MRIKFLLSNLFNDNGYMSFIAFLQKKRKMKKIYKVENMKCFCKYMLYSNQYIPTSKELKLNLDEKMNNTDFIFDTTDLLHGHLFPGIVRARQSAQLQASQRLADPRLDEGSVNTSLLARYEENNNVGNLCFQIAPLRSTLTNRKWKIEIRKPDRDLEAQFCSELYSSLADTGPYGWAWLVRREDSRQRRTRWRARLMNDSQSLKVKMK